MNISLIESSNAFGLKTEGIPCGNGHINSTFTAEKDGEKYVLQLINTSIFKNPTDMMNNMCKVTNHIRAKVMQVGGDCVIDLDTVMPGSMLYDFGDAI